MPATCLSVRQSTLLGALLLVTLGVMPPLHGGDASGAPLRVVATTTVLTDIARHIGGTRVHVASLLRPGVDAHLFQPTPADAATVAGAALVISNGLGLEGWIDALVKQSGFRGRIAVASQGVTALKAEVQAGHEGHDHGADPHIWHDARNGLIMAENIRAALTTADPAGAADYQAWHELYAAQLRATDVWARRQIAQLPDARRVLVTSHDALRYFGAAYGLRVVAAEGVSTGQEPEAAHIAALIDRLRREKIPAVFIENAASPKLVERLARDAGARLGGTLYADSLGEADGPAGSYLGMLASNVRTVVAALSAP